MKLIHWTIVVKFDTATIVMDIVSYVHKHITRLVHKANQRADLIKRSFTANDQNLLTTAFIVYARQLLKHWSAVCGIFLVILKISMPVLRNVNRRRF